MPVDERRYAVGMIVDEIKDRELIERMQKDNYKIFKLPQSVQSIYTTFPFINVLSIFIAITRVYYRLTSYIQVNIKFLQIQFQILFFFRQIN